MMMFDITGYFSYYREATYVTQGIGNIYAEDSA